MPTASELGRHEILDCNNTYAHFPSELTKNHIRRHHANNAYCSSKSWSCGVHVVTNSLIGVILHSSWVNAHDSG